MRFSFTLAVLFVVLIAGCNGLANTSTPTPTASPAPVPPKLPPGVTDDGDQDASVLVSAHQVALADTPHLINVTETRRNADSPVQWRYAGHRRVAPDEARHHTVVTVEGVNQGFRNLQGESRLETYRDGQTIYFFETNGTATFYARSTTRVADPLLIEDSLEALFSATDMAIEERKRKNGTTLYRLNASNVTEPALFAQAITRFRYDSVDNTSFTTLVDPRGFIHEYRVEYTIIHEGTATHVTREVQYRTNDSIAVTEPPWLDDAKANTTET